MKNTQLEERFDASENARKRSYSEMQEIKDRMYSLEEHFNAEGFQSFRDDPFSTLSRRRLFARESVPASVFGMLHVIG